MMSFTAKELKQELMNRTPDELMELCLRLSKFKRENKEFLTYLLFESSDDIAYVEGIKVDVDQQFKEINKKSYFYIKKSVRKILNNIKKHIRFSQKKETEIELLLYFCAKLKSFSPSIHRDKRLQNLYNVQIEMIRKRLALLHEDLQHDYGIELDALETKHF